MSYTLAKWALWLIASAVIGVTVGWLLRGLRRNAAVEPSAEDAAELELLRDRVADLEPIAADHARLHLELEEAKASAAEVKRSAARVVSETPAPAAPTGAAAAADPGVVVERDRLAALVVEHETTIGDLRARLWNHEARIGELQSQLSSQNAATAPPEPDLEAGAAVIGEKVRFNDLTVVEGIGPKIADMLHINGGIKTWWDLHNADAEMLRSLLAAAGPRFQIHDPGSWPHQAGLLARGQWQEFKTLADALKGGR